MCCKRPEYTGESQSCVEYNMTITRGVPQGSALGPLLFLLYINDMPNCSNKLSFRIFADDSNLFFASKTLKELESVMNNELKLVRLRYCATNKLSVNLKKTNYNVPYIYS